MAARSFEEVELWRKAHAWVLAVYRFTKHFPKHELFGLTSQLRRAAVSVPANFAEGFKKRSRAGKIRFYNIAQGSLEECRYYFILARDLNYGDPTTLKSGAQEISKMLDSYMRSLLSAP
ncbi:MAG: four helix bundle protein [Acidobacteria bacterium]|nr:four helix bundle protein [Acidobacteriota bacterium]